MELDEFLNMLWLNYSSMNGQAKAIHDALEARGENIVNDHIAFRTFNLPKVGMDVLAVPFLESGYRPAAGPGYEFPEKHLFARYFQHPDPAKPKVFISELKVEAFNKVLQNMVRGLVDRVPEGLTRSPEFLISGAPWGPMDWQMYRDLMKESEYAAWMLAFGFRVNHFTIFFNALKTFRDLEELNDFIKTLGFPLNSAGGEIKGTKKDCLEQSSTLASSVEVAFTDRKVKIPGCYYEFARRYPDRSGKLFQGFLPESANKIFESTHYRF